MAAKKRSVRLFDNEMSCLESSINEVNKSLRDAVARDTRPEKLTEQLKLKKEPSYKRLHPSLKLVWRALLNRLGHSRAYHVRNSSTAKAKERQAWVIEILKSGLC